MNVSAIPLSKTRKENFVNNIIYFAIPLTFPHIVNGLLGMINVAILSKLGDIGIAVSAVSTQIFYILSLLIVGVTNGMSIFMARFYGAKDFCSIQKIIGISIVLTSVLSLIFSIITFFYSYKIASLLSTDNKFIPQSSIFLKIYSLRGIFTALVYVYTMILRNIREIKLVITVSITSMMLNTILIYVLINIHFLSFGVNGVAIAAVFSTCIEAILLIIYTKKNSHTLVGSYNEIINFTDIKIKNILKQLMPVLFNTIISSSNSVIYALICVKISTYHIVAYNIVTTIEKMFILWFCGISTACAIMVGTNLGAKNLVQANNWEKRYIIFTLIIGLLLGMVLYLNINTIVSFFTVSVSIEESVKKMLLICSLFIVVKLINMIIYFGILRPRGDTMFSLLANGLATWGITVPMLYFVGLIHKAPIELLYICIFSEDIFNFIVGIYRLISKHWCNSIVKIIPIQINESD